MIPLYVNGHQKDPLIICPWSPQSRQLPKISPPPLNLLTCPNDPTSISYLVQNDPPQCPHLPKVTSLHLLTLKKFGPQIHPKSPPLHWPFIGLLLAAQSPHLEKMLFPYPPPLTKVKNVEIFLNKLEKVEKKLKEVEKRLEKWKKVKNVEIFWKGWKNLKNIEKVGRSREK